MPSTEVRLKHKEVHYVVLQNLSQVSEKERLRKLANTGADICDGNREGMKSFVSGLKALN